MQTAERGLLVVAALAAGIAFVTLAPGGLTPDAAREHLVAVVSALLGLVAAAGAGGALLQRLGPDLLDDDRGLLHAVTLGLGCWGLLASLLAAAGLLQPRLAAALPAVLAAGWLFRPALRLPRPGPLAWMLAALVAVPALLSVLAPAVDTDELYQHLALPAELLRAGGFSGGLLHPDGSRPMLLHAATASMLALGGDSAVRVLHLGVGLVALDGVRAMGRAWLGPRGAWAPLLLLGSWTVVQPLGVAGSDLPTMLAVTAALDAALRGRAWVLALAAGVALGFKYTAAGALVGVFLVARLPWRWRFLAGGLALATVTPWWLRNVLDGLHPLFPFAGWSPAAVHAGAPGAAEMPFQYLEKYGAGRQPLDFLLLPLNAVLTAQPDSFRFLGRLNPLFLALLPTALLALRRPLTRRFALAAAVACLAWAAGPHWLRYLLPALPALALFLAAGAPQGPGIGRAALVACGLLGLPANWSPLLVQAADRLPAALGHEPADTFVARHHPPTAAITWANRHLPEDAVVALLYDWSRTLVQRPVLLGSVEDHVPVRHWLLTRGPRALDDLRDAGATHVIVTTTRFLPTTYPFLSDDERQRDLDVPGQLLDELLLRQGTLLYQDGRTRVLRLDASSQADAQPDLASPGEAR